MQAAAIRKGLVEERGWLTPEEYDRGLAFSSLCPGPVGSQLVVYIARLKTGVLGAAVCAVAFLSPAFIVTILAAMLYERYGSLPALHGVASAVMGIIVLSIWQLARSILGRDKSLWALALAAGAVHALGVSAIPLIVAGGALKAGLSRRGAAPVGAVFFFFLKSGALIFGTGLAILAAIRYDVTVTHGWVTDRQFLDALAVGLATPGPILMAVAFMGYTAAGLPGALAAAGGMFLPVFAITAAATPHVEKVAGNRRLRTFVTGATSAAVGIIATSAIFLSRDVTPWIAALGLVAALKLPFPVVALLGALAAKL